MYEISKDLWRKCEICHKSLPEIKKDFGGENKYFSAAFINHIEKCHNIGVEDYFVDYVKIVRPLCKCGVCGKKVKIARKYGSVLKWRERECGRFEGQQEWSKQAKITRRGPGNPMFGKKPWNKGLTKDTHNSLRIVSEKQKINAAMILQKAGLVKKTKPHIKMCSMLDELGIQYQEEVGIGCFVFDFYLPEHDVYIEADGDYWHSNPLKYPDGPINDIQKQTHRRDCYKNKFCSSNSITLLRFWEHDIKNHPEQVSKTIECTLNQLNPLDI